MRPITLTLEGFQGYRDSQHLDLSTIERAAITGRVGAGKSSLLDAIVYALFGKVRVPTKDGVINTACDKASVELEFTEREGRYRVSRTMTRSGNTKAYLWRWDEETFDWATLGDQDGRVGVTDQVIRDLIGLSWEAFRASVIVEQGKSSGFAEATPSERHALLSQIVGLDRWARMAEEAAEQRKAVRTAIAQTTARIEEQNSLLADAQDTKDRHALALAEQEATARTLEDLQTRRAMAAKDVDTARARLDLAQQQAHVATARAAADQALEQARRHDQEARRHLAAVEAEASQVADLEEQVAAAAKAVADADETLTARLREGEAIRDRAKEAEAGLSRADDELAVIAERMAGLTRHDSDGCFTCRQPLTADQRARIVADLEAERERVQERKATFASTLDTCAAERAQALARYNQAKADKESAQQHLTSLSAPLDRARTAAAGLDEARARADAARGALEAAQAAREALEGHDEHDLDAARRAHDQAVEALTDVETQIAQVSARAGEQATTVAVLADRIERHETARAAVESLTARLDELRKDEQGWSLLVEAYSPAGVPRMILDSAIEEINADLDAELTALSGGALTASLSTQRATKSGTMKAEITLTVVGPDGARVYESFSGGQRFLVDLALHLALTQTLARRNGAALDFLAIDEGWGAIEGEEREAVLRALHDLASQHDTLLLAITHVAEVADSFPNRIETEMISGTSVSTII